MMASKITVLEVNKADIANTQIIQYPAPNSLNENEVLLSIDKFALTANNISYGVTGDSLGYWKFFPSKNDGWGRLPAMGYSTVVSSNHPDVKEGERVWGFVPMASHVVVQVDHVSPFSFVDVSAHREGLAPVYATFDRVSASPHYQPENDDFEMLLRGLFTTSWLVDDFMQDNNYFTADQYLITSASSKTSIALAFAIKERGEKTTIGITSAQRCEFVRSLNCYDKVVSYEEISQLNANVPSILVDMAGGSSTLKNIHQHFNQQLKYSCRIGATQHQSLFIEGDIAGPEPIFFFAPSQIAKRTREWGRGEVMKRIATSLLRYIAFGKTSLTIEHTTNKDNVDAIYQTILNGTADASVGHIISFTQ